MKSSTLWWLACCKFIVFSCLSFQNNTVHCVLRINSIALNNIDVAGNVILEIGAHFFVVMVCVITISLWIRFWDGIAIECHCCYNWATERVKQKYEVSEWAKENEREGGTRRYCVMWCCIDLCVCECTNCLKFVKQTPFSLVLTDWVVVWRQFWQHRPVSHLFRLHYLYHKYHVFCILFREMWSMLDFRPALPHLFASSWISR